jgi:hypothetical protein
MAHACSTPPGRWTVVQTAPWPMPAESGRLVHSLYDEPEAVRAIIAWLEERRSGVTVAGGKRLVERRVSNVHRRSGDLGTPPAR